MHPFKDRLIAFTDLETTGINPEKHEIIEIGLVVMRPLDQAVIHELNLKVQPTRIQAACSAALKINGYDPNDWQEAVPLGEAIEQYSDLVNDALFCSQNTTFDWGFLAKAFYLTEIGHRIDYHHLDLFSLAFSKLWRTQLPRLSLSTLGEFFGLEPEPQPHRAINGAKMAYEIYKRLMAYPATS